MLKYLFNANLEIRRKYFKKIVENAKKLQDSIDETPDAFGTAKNAWFCTLDSLDDLQKKKTQLQELVDDLQIGRLFVYTADHFIPHYVTIDDYIFGYRIIHQGEFKNRVQVLAILDKGSKLPDVARLDVGIEYYVMTSHKVDINKGGNINLFNFNNDLRNKFIRGLRKALNTSEYNYTHFFSANSLISSDRLPLITVNSRQWLFDHAKQVKQTLMDHSVGEFAIVSDPCIADYVVKVDGYIFLFNLKDRRIQTKGIVEDRGSIYQELKKAYENEDRGKYPTAKPLMTVQHFDLNLLDLLRTPKN